jgi:(E)-4-hydroxy-3-methylbut-2-enyl-diphosphate synthase
MKRSMTRQIRLGSVLIGGSAPVSIQSMTNTNSTDIASTVKQIKTLEKTGCEIIRIAVKDMAQVRAISVIKSLVQIPIEADIHFDYRLAVASAEYAHGIRLNPGNVRKPSQVKQVIHAARVKGIPIRIGINSGSLPKQYVLSAKCGLSDIMVRAALDYIKIFEKERFFDIMISLKASETLVCMDAYRKISKAVDYPLHLGITAAGAGEEAVIKSAIGIGGLLSEGIGDTIRVSLTENPVREVIAAKEILQSLGLRRFYHEVISCPTCGRCQVGLEKIVKQVKKELVAYSLRHKANNFYSIAVMGCEVNGPGEAKNADIGIAFGKGFGMLFKRGKIIRKVSAKNAVNELIRELRGIDSNNKRH